MTDAIRREVEEELRVAPVSVGSVRASIRDLGSAFIITFVDVEIEGDPRPTEHDAVDWIATPDLGRYPLAPADSAFAFLPAKPGFSTCEVRRRRSKPHRNPATCRYCDST